MRNKFIPVAILALFSVSTSASAGVSVVGAVDYGGLNSHTESGATLEGGLGFGGGLLFGSSFESGAIYLSRKFESEGEVLGETVTSETSVSVLHVPVRYRFGKGAFSFGIGAFAEIVLESGGGVDFGVAAGPRLMLGKRFFIDATFNYELSGDPNAKQLLGLVGFRF